jgi:hypothetical protein
MIWQALVGAVSKLFLFVAMLAASWFGGKKTAQADAKVEGLEDYVETRQRMDEVGRMSDADAALDFLRERGKR